MLAVVEARVRGISRTTALTFHRIVCRNLAHRPGNYLRNASDPFSAAASANRASAGREGAPVRVMIAAR